MKIKLLSLLAVALSIMQVEGIHAQESTVSTSAELQTALADASITSITLNDGAYNVLSGVTTFLINRSVTIQGRDTNSVSIGIPFGIQAATGTIVSFNRVHLNATTSLGKGIIDITSGGVTVNFTDSKMTILTAGTGTGTGGATSSYGIVSQTGETMNENTINVTRSRIAMMGAVQRGLAFRDGYGHTLNFTESKIEGPAGASGHAYVYGISTRQSNGDTNSKPVTLTIKDSVIDVNYYAVSTDNTTTVPVVIHIDKSDITAWAALYLRGDNALLNGAAFPQTVKISETRLTGRSHFNGSSDDFGALVFENCQQLNLTIDTKSSITVLNTMPIVNPQARMWIADIRKNTAGTIAFIPNGTAKSLIENRNSAYAPLLFNIENSETSALQITGIENVEFKDETGKPFITIYKEDQWFRNATNSLVTAFQEVQQNDRIVLPAGEYTLPPATTIDKPLTLVGAGPEQTFLKGRLDITVTNAAKVNFEKLSLEGAGNSIDIGTDKGDENPFVTLTDSKIKSTDASGIRLRGKGTTLSLKNTDIDAHYYGIGVRNEGQKVTIDGGTITGWAALMTSAGGLTNGTGTLARTGTTLDIKNATLQARTISNEKYGVLVLQEKYNGVALTIDKSTLIATSGGAPGLELGEKQLSALDLRSYGNTVTVTNSTLSSPKGENAQTTAVVALGWSDADFGEAVAGSILGSDKSVPALNSIQITGSTLTGKAGEKQVVTYRTATNQPNDALTINGTSYSTNVGNVYRLFQSSKDNVLVDDQGKPAAIDAASLAKIINAAADGSTVTLAGNIELTASLTINKQITLDGNNRTLTAGAGFDGYLITVTADGAGIKNLTLDHASKAKGLNVINALNVRLDNLTSKDGKEAGVTVNNSTVTASALFTSGNASGGVNVNTGTPKFTFTSGSLTEAIPIYSDITNNDGIVVALNGWTKTVTNGKAIWKLAAILPTLTAPTATTLEAGQALSASILSGGKATTPNGTTISGVFTWKNPAEKAVTNKQTYTALFTPGDLLQYDVAETEVAILNIKQYYTVTTDMNAHGKTTIDQAHPANKYENGKTLKITYLPDNGYTTSAPTSHTVTKDTVLMASFTPIIHTVTIVTPQNGTISVTNGGMPVTTSASLAEGTILSVQATPAATYSLATLTGNTYPISNGTVTVNGDLSIGATFTAVPASGVIVTTTAVAGGHVQLFEKGNTVASGSSVALNAKLNAIAIPDLGYAINADVTATNASLLDKVYTITGAAVFSATFTKQSYPVTFVQPVGGTLTVTGINPGSQQLFGTELTATVTQNSADMKYRLLALLVNGKEIPNGGTFTVTAATEVKAVLRELAELFIDPTPQTFLYDGSGKGFVVNTIPAGVSGYTLAYGPDKSATAPQEAGTYDVYVSRPADNMYDALTDKKIAGGLKIEQIDMPGLAIPSVVGSNLPTSFSWRGDSSNPIATAQYNPSNTNYRNTVFSIPTGNGTPDLVTYDWSTVTWATRQVGTRAGGETLNITSSGEGTITLWNGSTQLTGGSLYATQTITLKATANADYSADVKWVINGAPAITGSEATILLVKGANTISATFARKVVAPLPTLTIPANAVYNGSPFGGKSAPAVTGGTVIDNWLISFTKAGETTVLSPTEAGTYDIYVSRPADKNYNAVVNQKLKSQLTISQKASNAIVTAATDILVGESLAKSVLSGHADVDGVFEWTDPNTPVNKAGSTAATAKFTPKNKNYAGTLGLTMTITVKATGVTLRTISLKGDNAIKGIVTLTLNGTATLSGEHVTKGDKLTVNVAPISPFTASFTVSGASLQSGVYVVNDGAENVVVTVIYASPGDSYVDVTGVSLDITSKTLSPKGEFTLNATITPANATNKDVVWASTNATVATVTDGKVNALKAGTCEILVTTVDGSYTASCSVTVDTATGLEEIDGFRIYASEGQIHIEPLQAVDVQIIAMTGVIIYQNRISGSVQIPATTGIYAVKLSDGKTVHLVKIAVH